MDGAAATGSPDRRAGWGQRVQPAPARLVGQEAPNHQRIPQEPRGAHPMAGNRARVATKQVHEVMGETGDVNGHVQQEGHKATSHRAGVALLGRTMR